MASIYRVYRLSGFVNIDALASRESPSKRLELSGKYSTLCESIRSFRYCYDLLKKIAIPVAVGCRHGWRVSHGHITIDTVHIQ